MNYFNRSRRLNIVTSVLLVLNAALMVFVLVRNRAPKMPDRPPHAGHAVRTAEFLQDELDFSDSQVKEFMKLQANFMKVDQEYRSRIQQAKRTLYTGLRTYGDIPEDKTEIMDMIAENTRLREENTFSFFNTLKDLCTESQMDDYDKLLGRILMKIDPEHRPPEDQRPHAGPGTRGPSDGPPPPPEHIRTEQP